MSTYVRMEDTEVFLRVRKLSNSVFGQVKTWDRLAQDTVGKHLIRSTDSVGANLVEGEGRETKADGLRFLVMARASARQARYWLGLACDREWIGSQSGSELLHEMTEVGKMVSGLIRVRKSGVNVREETATYAPFLLSSASI